MPLFSLRSERVATHRPDALRPRGDYVLYWMSAQRRATSNYALDAALACAKSLQKPLVVLEALRAGYPWACTRFHRFVLDGMHDNRRNFRAGGVCHYAYVEPTPGAGKGLLAALARPACCVFTDDFPAFFLPRALAAAAGQMDCALFAIDGNGLFPMRAGRDYPTAAVFRRALHKYLLLGEAYPQARALHPSAKLPQADVPKAVRTTWPEASDTLLAYGASVASVAVSDAVAPVSLRGGSVAAHTRCAAFIADRLAKYPERNHPDDDSASGISPYLHFGHIGAHDVLRAVMQARGIRAFDFRPKHIAKRRGFYGADEDVEGFIDQLLTWRELGYVFAHHRPNDYDRYSSVPDWARRSLADHAADVRDYTYTLDELDRSQTHDEVWNAAQTQLRQTGVMHNYLRMLWGKKVLQWNTRPEHAFAQLVELNNRYALDGRDPNSYTGIAWTFGRHDRAWGPERPIFGKVRYMTSENTRKKLRLKKYLERYAPAATSAG